MIIAGVVVARTMIGNHFKKKFSKRSPPDIIVKTVEQREFQNKIETFGTAVPVRVQSYNIEKIPNLSGPINDFGLRIGIHIPLLRNS